MFEGFERINYQLGDKIFQVGEKGDSAYLIERGSIEISVHLDKKFVRVKELGKGELFGEMALFENHRRIATATALEETCVVRINRDLIEAKLAKTDPVIKHLLRLVLQRLRQIHYKFCIEKRKT
jgi:CRP-like cAMP-binding protein